MDGTGTDRDQSTGRRAGHRRLRWLTPAAIVGLVLVAGVIAAIAWRVTTAEDAPPVVHRDDPVADLLGWLPASEENRRAFAVWAGEPDAGATPSAIMDVGVQDSLGLVPSPPMPGHGLDWGERDGWAAGHVTAWAVAGQEGGRTAILAGEFDLEAVRDALQRSGHRATRYRGASIHVLQPAATPGPVADRSAPAVNAVGILAGRLIVASSEDAVRAAIDAALGAAPSLADDKAVVSLLTTAGHSAGLAAIDAADLAAVCAADDPTARAPDGPPSGRYVATVFGRSGLDGQRQTAILVTSGDETVAQSAVTAWEYGWVDAVVALGDVAAPVASYATLATTGATDETLIARFVDGRVEGWAPLALRLAAPVCAAVAELAPPPTPAEAVPPLTAAARRAIALAALPDAGEAGTFVFADLAATGSARGVAAPTATTGQAPPAHQVAAWLAALAPLPPLTVLPADPAVLAQVPVRFGIGLDELHLVAETQAVDLDATIGLFVGAWDPARVEAALRAAGYASIRLGDALVFAAPTGSALSAGVPAAWANAALIGDRLLLSPSSRALRAAIEAAAESPVSSARSDLLALTPDATSGIVVGGEAARRDCAARGITGQRPAWRAFAAIWTAPLNADEAAAALIALPADGVRIETMASELEGQLERLRVVIPAGDGTPASAGPALVDALDGHEIEVVGTPAGSAVIAAFAGSGATGAIDFYATVDRGCALAARP